MVSAEAVTLISVDPESSTTSAAKTAKAGAAEISKTPNPPATSDFIFRVLIAYFPFVICIAVSFYGRLFTLRESAVPVRYPTREAVTVTVDAVFPGTPVTVITPVTGCMVATAPAREELTVHSNRGE
jgi:hypothetical protein